MLEGAGAIQYIWAQNWVQKVQYLGITSSDMSHKSEHDLVQILGPILGQKNVY